jgi:KaiC/GvpD/RAD55 family RecA-like ATPase
MRERRSRSIDEVLSALEKVSRSGEKRWRSRCPAHDDSDPSLSIGVGDRGITLKCHAGCTFEAIVEALGLRPEELFDDEPFAKGERPTGARPVGDRRPNEGVTVETLAAKLKLPVEHLRQYGICNAISHGQRAVEFPHVQRDGSKARTHVRLLLDDVKGQQKWRWKDDATREAIVPYDPNGGALAQLQRQLVIVEGETDTLTLLYAGFGALGLPGAKTSDKLTAAHVEGIEHVFVVQEKGEAGTSFAAQVPLRLGRLGFTGGVHVVKPGDAKDVSDLFVRDPQAFPNLMQALVDAAREPPPLSKSLRELIFEQAWDGVAHPTGFRALDGLLLQKGLPSSSIIVLLGQPGAKKTALAVQWADEMSVAGAAVLVVAADEGRKNMATRIGQRMGFNRLSLISRQGDDIGDAVRAEYDRREAALEERGRTLRIVDPRAKTEARTVEEAHDELIRYAKGRPRVLVVDSLQKAPFRSAAELKSAADGRAVVNAKLEALEDMRQTGTTVILLCETNRTFYATPATEADENGRVIAGARESGNVEYAADLLIGMFRVADDQDIVKIVVGKSRISDEVKFRLRWDKHRATLSELEPGEGGGEPEVSRYEEPKVEGKRREATGLRADVLRQVVLRPGTTSREVRAALALVKPIGIDAVMRALDELRLQGVVLLREEARGRRAYYPIGVRS